MWLAVTTKWWIITGRETDDEPVREDADDDDDDDDVGGRAGRLDDVKGVLFSWVRCRGHSCLLQIGQIAWHLSLVLR